jgi:hypothetical protein
MKQILKTIAVLALLIGVVACGNKPRKKGEWVELFNGKNLDGWTPKINHYDVGVNYDSTFFVKDGVISVRYRNYGNFDDRFGHLFYERPFLRYHLKLEYRFADPQQPGAPEWTRLNSGVMFHSQDPRTILKNQDWPIAVEMQFLATNDASEVRPTGNMCSPGTDIVFEGKKYDGHCLNSSSKTFSPYDWVRAELVVYGDSLILHLINGDTVLRYSNPTMGGGVVAGYDSAVFEIGKALKSGFIGLQSEGQPVDFRNIFIRELE